MGIDMSKYRRNSSYARLNCDKPSMAIKNMYIRQAIYEFDLYQKNAPNTFDVYIRGNDVPILGTLLDVSDLEAGSDSKWLLTSLRHEVSIGDIVIIDGKRWMCVYDKKKTTQNCYKVKIRPCNYTFKFPYFTQDKSPNIYTADTITFTYLTDIIDYKQPFPIETGTIYVTLQYNDITSSVKKESRMWLYNSAHKITGVDYTNVDFYSKKGFLKWTLRPDLKSNDLDNIDLGICNYYEYFDRKQDAVSNEYELSVELSKPTVKSFDKVDISVSNTLNEDKVIFTFEGDNLGCILTNVTNNSCILETRRDIGFLYVKCFLEKDPSKYAIVRVVIKN